ncbi:DIE2/ALG10 family-domain-containing protein [Mrakia frigida]|uniref:dolichyl-P-Glc:Glc(2)Man(9)GlcNAc(2)-PP-dolichol alpha-1,2- glucosyltransferase n=1 Tax=Mrakia frigida TaxID=29902 RepID=UPI003FCBFCA4
MPPPPSNSSRKERLLALAGFLFFSIGAFVLVQKEVKEPYMDEIFHIPQAQQYCSGNFKDWDPKLTTPPGLANSSSTASWKPSVESLAISFFPPLWFFSNLYYTDVGSCMFVLASWAAARSGRNWFSSVLGLISLTFRQTNIIWLGFIMAMSVFNALEDLPRKKGRSVDHSMLAREYESFPRFLLHNLLHVPVGALAHPRAVLVPKVLPYIPTFVAFVLFIRWNGGIVLGHKEMHVATIHLPQTLYFFAFATVLGWPVLLNVDGGLKGLIRRSINDALGGSRQIMATSALVVAATLAIKYFTIAHPFLLADNRHYAFYIYRRLINPFPVARYILGLGYVACAIVWSGRLLRSQPPLPLLIFLFATIATLTPSPLIEPRYFLLPFLILRILASPSQASNRPSKTPSSSSSTPAATRKRRLEWIELGWYALVNAVTMGVFLRVKFRWESEEGVWQRFMW